MNDSIEDCVSPPYIETFNSKLIKGFLPEQEVVTCFRISRFLCSIVMNIICLFRTWPYSCIWLCNNFIWFQVVLSNANNFQKNLFDP